MTNLIALIATIPVTIPLGSILQYNFVFLLFSNILIGITQTLLIIFIFSSARLKKGVKFLYKVQHSELFAFLSLGITIFYYTFRLIPEKKVIYTTIMLFIVIIGIFIYINIQKEITENYLRQHYSRTLESLENELMSTKKDKDFWFEYSQKLGSIIHKDNKLIPAMMLSIDSLIKDYSPEKANLILSDLNKLSNERKGIILEHIHNTSTISETGCIRIDAIINLMFQRAKDYKIDFEYNYNNDIKNITPTQISTEDLSTVIADLLENAIISAKDGTFKNIKLSINAKETPHCICIYDSGPLFDHNVLSHLGKQRCTTHKKDGGTGIGLMTTFEIIKKYNASFSIDEKIDSPPYSKCLSITFDQKHTHTYNGGPI